MKRSRYKQPIYPQPCSDNWLNQVKEALTHPNFKITPPKTPMNPLDISLGTGTLIITGYNGGTYFKSYRSLTIPEIINYGLYRFLIAPKS